MKLAPAELTVDYPFLRLVSESQVWEVGIGKLTITGGIRIVAGKVGSQSFEVTYCAGQDKGMAIGILAQVLVIISAMPESISCHNFRNTFPVQTIKPMINDFKCWEALTQKSKEVGDTVEPLNLGLTSSLQANFPGD
ncbi:hypothetical protein VF14_03360 [Nostoc linckia z18]|jgi:hypothetical protein|uniref:Uncharacterized protein n=2 Tax=Nostoc linckia TaxID=92942 RepID=A0A9Q5ZH50_NOSLI|nr:hypothetical protein [Nostoc linckia]PHK42413.1 hypothetical protein VF12_03375 [Nostoc linckia z15]PHK46921.1 hypothetical protein VF13_08000 [Nostoc linckia z16]PHJ69183.1 hypothetical protein VF02_00830 [Nostoc linckia z1]PHJ73334.1 hypothetical protein VF05_01845 [Nostoc linckia z3]PHJ78681.1 hypothetical protein VF03_00830 [Nostoc linckia z2]